MTGFPFTRHAELVSASILPRAQSLMVKWTLKQVQGDEVKCSQGA